MAADATPVQLLLARLAVVLAVVLVALGLLLYGFSTEVHERIWRDIAARPGGPMTIRFILQPSMAAIAAFHDGARDARRGRSADLRPALPRAGAERLWEDVIGTARILLLGFAMDAIYQATVLKTFYPGEMLLIAILLAFLPYVLLREFFGRLLRRRAERRTRSSPIGGGRD